MEDSGFTLEEQTLQHAKLSAGGHPFFYRSVSDWTDWPTFDDFGPICFAKLMEALVLSPIQAD